MAKKRDLAVIIERVGDTPSKYDYFLMSNSEEGLRIDFAQSNESNKNKLELIVKQSVVVPADKMLSFCSDVIQSLIEYENAYNNGKGLRLPEMRDEELM
ncbi:MAG: hypothetical protein IJB67_05235 [Firmicutes bacterium]|nr:hypothetical protein [Bacillota bacterium]